MALSRSVKLLYQPLQKKVWAFLDECKKAGLPAKVFETYRTPSRQEELLQKRTTRQGAWDSWHQYGLCFDVVFYDDKAKNWYWESSDWDKVGQIGKSLGLRWGGDWTTFTDKPHFEYDTKGLTVEEAKRIALQDGVLAVWAEIERREYDGKPIYRSTVDGAANIGTFASHTANSLESSQEEKEPDSTL